MLQQIKMVFQQHVEKLAFRIGNQSYRYADYLGYISGIRQLIREAKPSTHFIGLAAYDDIETYAAILALWSEGHAFVPLSPKSSAIRNKNILEQVESTFVLSSKAPSTKLIAETNINWLATADLQAVDDLPDFSKLDSDQILCMLFTSGSTGVPKGVPYTYKNINTTLDAFFDLTDELDEKDRFLQMFELTFDMSMLSYLPAWCIGASVHTVNPEGIKYLNAFQVMQEQEISFAAMVPSTLQLLQPYFPQIDLKALRFCLLGGEPFYTELAKAWMNCVPNAAVINISGPCETTMACMGYLLNRDFEKNKSHKGVLAFGKPWKHTKIMLLDANGKEAELEQEGELCFGGDHVMEGYWKMPAKNATLFFEREVDGEKVRFYRSGDLAFQDAEGTFYSCGRKDIQYKIQGYKVELGDIEQHAKAFMQKGNAAALVHKNDKGLLDIHLFVDQAEISIDALLDDLKKQLPTYMWPRSIRRLKQLPLTISGKLDRGALKDIFEGADFDWITRKEMSNRIAHNLFSMYRQVAAVLDISLWKETNLESVAAESITWPRTLFGRLEITQLEKTKALIRNGELPPNLILQRPIEMERLYNELGEQGFRHMMTWPGMAINLLAHTFTEDQTNARLLQTESELIEWQSIVNEVLFEKSPLALESIKKLWASEGFLFYGLSVDNELVAVAMGFITEQSYGIYMLATKPSQRRKGFGKALTLYMLQDAKQRNCQAAYLQSSAMGTAMYQQIGFKTFCDFDIFWLLGVW